MSRTPRVLVVSQYWEPAQRAGGARCTQRALASLGDELDLWVVTGDRDVGDRQPWTDVDPRQWVVRPGGRVLYQRWAPASIGRLRRAMAAIDPDVIYLPSLFAPGSLAVLALHRLRPGRAKVVVAPEGELQDGAMAHHRGRKGTAVALVRALGIGARIRWRAANRAEAQDLRAVFGPWIDVLVAPDLAAPRHTSATERTPKHPGAARIVFLSNIVPKKGLARAIELVSAASTRSPDGAVSFDIYGPIGDAAEWDRCLRSLQTQGHRLAWRYHGTLPYDEVTPTLTQADLLILPTLGENHGYVIEEALAAGCPVLVSDRTPWRSLAQSGCGWDLPLGDDGAWTTRLSEVVHWDETARASAGRAARERAAGARGEAESQRTAWRDLLYHPPLPSTA